MPWPTAVPIDRNSLKVTQPGVPAYAWAGTAVTTVPRTAVAAAVRRILVVLRIARARFSRVRSCAVVSRTARARPAPPGGAGRPGQPGSALGLHGVDNHTRWASFRST